METIYLPVYGIIVTLDGEGSGTIERSSQFGTQDFSDTDSTGYWAAIDGIESLILAHACAGINVASKAYCDGIFTAVEKIVQVYE